MRSCPRCGTENPPEANFCLWCGAGLRTRIGSEERKIITVLFCDLEGFTAAAERMDPEDVGATLRRYHTVAKDQIEGHGGTVEKFLGDGVIGVFGMPVAHEDDPERAIRAALRIVEGVAGLRAGHGTSLPVRVGVTTGEALVSTVPGEQVGGAIAGDVVNTAARLQAAAPPNGVLVAGRTYRATASHFVFAPHEPVRAKGKTDPVAVWRPLRAKGRIGVDRDVPDAPFVGRASALADVVAAFDRACAGPEAVTAVILGDAGIGKSRLAREFSTHVEALPDLVRWRRGRCLPYGEGVRFSAIGEIVKAEADILDTDDPVRATAALDEALAVLGIDDATRPWLASLLGPLVGLPGPANPPPRDELFAGIRRFIGALAADRPTVLVLEDLQWADAVMLELVGSLTAQLDAVPLLVIAVARTEIEDHHPGWVEGLEDAVRIPLDVLDPDASRTLIHALVGGEPLTGDEEESLVGRAGGNPLFAEEYVRMRRDVEAAAASASGLAADLPMPESLRALAAARLDALPAELKSLVLDASIVGRVFWPGALAEVGESDRDEVAARLPFLLRRRLIERREPSTIDGEAEFAFRHDVTMRVAYDQIPRAARAVKHRHAAAWTRLVAGERVADVADTLAHHLEQALACGAGDPELVTDLASATLLVAERLASLDAPGAVRAYQRALELIGIYVEDRPDVLAQAGQVAEAAGRFDLADGWYREAVAAFEREGDPRRVGDTLGLLGRSLVVQGRIDEADEAFGRAVAVLDALPPGPELARICARLAGRAFVDGDYAGADAWAARTLEVAIGGEPRDAVAMALQYRGSVRAERGDPAGLDDLREAIRIAREADLADVLGISLGNLAYLTWFREGPAAAREIAHEIEAFGASHGFVVLEMWGKAAEVESCFDLGEWDRVLELADEMLAWDAVHGPSQIGALAHFGATWVHIRRGDLGPARTALTAVEREPAFTSFAESRATTAAMRAVLAAEDRDATALADAIAAYDQSTADLPETRVHLLPVVVRAAIAGGLLEEATALVPADPGAPIERRRLSHRTAVAAIAEARGDLATASVEFEVLADAWDAFGFPLEVGQCLLALGRCRLARGVDGTQALESARERFLSLGATPLVAATELLRIPIR